MASNRATSEPDGNGQDGGKESEDKIPHCTAALETLASVAVATATPATAPTVEPPTMDDEVPTVETIEDIAKLAGDNADDETDGTDDITEEDIREAINQVMHDTFLENLQFIPPHAFTSGNGEESSSAPAYRQHDCIVARTVNRHAPYLAEVPDRVLGQVWIDHIDSLIGVRTPHQTDEMQYCIEQTDRIVQLANNVLKQQRELLADLRRISSEIPDFRDSDKDDGNGDGDGDGSGDSSSVSGGCALNE
ncbi:hypothetical protein PITC_006600 [Penicillium italicum]|uniref:Uncharacterized protein n=1 Tax=Penicillium italicum TaxID=40296 RepID=A0A0A2L7P0_PENIT|nr:hypothetical protein PITC_006600 [Penicillium italicum]